MMKDIGSIPKSTDPEFTDDIMKLIIGIKHENTTTGSPVTPSSSGLCNHSLKLSLFIPLFILLLV